MQKVSINYTNWKGEQSDREIEPHALIWGSNEWHPEPQWLLYAWDVQKQAMRQFAMKDIHSWIPADHASKPVAEKHGRIMLDETDFEPMSAEEKWRRDNWEMQPEARYMRNT